MAMSRLDGCRSLIARPSMRISPAVIGSSPAMVLSSVDLPQPDGPTSTRNPPSSICDVDALQDLQSRRSDFCRLLISRKAMAYPFTAPAIRPRTK